MPLFFQFIYAAGKIGGTGLIFSILLYALAIYEHHAGKNAPASYFAGAGTVAFCCGCFAAWLEERRRRLVEEEKHISPNFRISFGQMLMRYSPEASHTFICIQVMIINSGSPSIATPWKARYTSPSLDITVNPIVPHDQRFIWEAPDGSRLVLKRDEFLTTRSLTAIKTGEGCRGRLIFEIPGNRLPELNSQAGVLWVGVNDYTGRLCQEQFVGYPATELLTWGDEEIESQNKPNETSGFQRLFK